jgi:hypothetical protein
MSLPPKDAYTLFYLEPLLVSRNPVIFEQEHQKYTFKATGDREALAEARRFLAQGVISCNLVSKSREGKRLQKDHPLQTIETHFRTKILKLTGS